MAEESPRQSLLKPRVAIVAVNWNDWRDTIECIASARQLDYPNYLMIVVDNDSHDDSLGRFREWAHQTEGCLLVEYPEATACVGGEAAQEQALAATSPANRLVLIRGGSNSGPTGGGNRGIEYALRRPHPADYVFLLDNDAQVEKETLSHLVELDQKENAGIVGGAIVDAETGQLQYAERTTFLRWFFSPFVRADLPLPEGGVDYWASAGVSGGAMLLRSDALEAVHSSTGRYLADDLFRDGWEFEFCHRSNLAGYRSFVTRKGFVRHKGDRFARFPLNPKRYYYRVRNRIELAATFLPLHWRLLFYSSNLLVTFGQILKALKHGKPRVAQAIVRGTVDGYKGVKGKWKEQDAGEGVRETLGSAAS